ncbi:hypothetical protein FACS1894110_05560 [Spirochaetia bacterium]|nr:hypothetical protein FACS1894110_05560 [Spirochaetia bacterium]
MRKIKKAAQGTENPGGLLMRICMKKETLQNYLTGVFSCFVGGGPRSPQRQGEQR